jgi:hypothetical protein
MSQPLRDEGAQRIYKPRLGCSVYDIRRIAVSAHIRIGRIARTNGGIADARRSRP